jgi:hypothetical protein
MFLNNIFCLLSVSFIFALNGACIKFRQVHKTATLQKWQQSLEMFKIDNTCHLKGNNLCYTKKVRNEQTCTQSQSLSNHCLSQAHNSPSFLKDFRLHNQPLFVTPHDNGGNVLYIHLIPLWRQAISFYSWEGEKSLYKPKTRLAWTPQSFWTWQQKKWIQFQVQPSSL